LKPLALSSLSNLSKKERLLALWGILCDGYLALDVFESDKSLPRYFTSSVKTLLGIPAPTREFLVLNLLRDYNDVEE